MSNNNGSQNVQKKKLVLPVIVFRYFCGVTVILRTDFYTGAHLFVGVESVYYCVLSLLAGLCSKLLLKCLPGSWKDGDLI